MKKKINRKKLERTEKLILKNRTRNKTGKTIFPNGVQVGLNDHAFKKGLRVFGKIDTSDDILLFGNSIAAAVLDIELNPSSIVMFGDPADKEIFIQPSTITADAAYSGRQMSYDGLALSAKDVKKDFSYRPFFAGITGDNGIFSISKVIVNAITGSATGSFKNPLSGNVKLFDSHNTQFMTLNFSSDASTGDLTISPFLDQTRTNNKLINDITLKIPFAAKSNNPKPLVVNKEVHVQKLEFPVTANYFTTPSVYVLRKNASNQFSTLDLKAVPYSVNYVEGYNYGSGATEVSASNLIPNATGSVGSVNTLANGSFTIKSVRDLFCSSSSASTMTQPATTGSDRYKVRLTALSGADGNATFAAREIETLYKTTTGLIGSDRIIQQFIVQEERESVTIITDDVVNYITHNYTGYDAATHTFGVNMVDARSAFPDTDSDAAIKTITHPSGTVSIAMFSEPQPELTPTVSPNKISNVKKCLLSLPMASFCSSSHFDSNLALPGTSLMGLSLGQMFSNSVSNDSLVIPAGSFTVSISATFQHASSIVKDSSDNVGFYVLLVESSTSNNHHRIIDPRGFPASRRRTSSYRVLKESNRVYYGEDVTDGGYIMPTRDGQHSATSKTFTLGFTVDQPSPKRYTLAACFEFDGSVNTLFTPEIPNGFHIHVPKLTRTNLTMTVTEL